MSRETQSDEVNIPNKCYLLHFSIIQGETPQHWEIAQNIATSETLMTEHLLMCEPLGDLKSPGPDNLNDLQ